ncbi:hypothetical protein [Bacillus toyonensis]|jgi:hypothetical protein|uniref:hypothetical protein n=1 Tax=Bacillus toyonensis TaxID=155322 RepID=UPI000BF1D400|nr:hypothetical protein [Bacillus toyonensis]PEL23419.1 hypothetical protein CN624_21200 [Bacillus toyonensis]PFY49099.1 hypothetical protein COL55_13405 [Bacillus toyonensis]PFY86000.1 hypothetical protein COL62_02060 [Bacillus toyonensis]PHD51847.1 hypothetical protein COF75_07395 [Bacillus toyonensis]
MRINHEHEAIKDKAEELFYEFPEWSWDDIFYAIYADYDITRDELEQLLIEVEHRVNDVPNEGYIIEGDESLYSN